MATLQYRVTGTLPRSSRLLAVRLVQTFALETFGNSSHNRASLLDRRGCSKPRFLSICQGLAAAFANSRFNVVFKI
jgi:hypothetical protein